MFTVSIERRPDYVLAVATGAADVHCICSGAVFVADVLRRTGGKRLMFDMTALTPQLERAEALEVISTLYASMPSMEKIAILAPQQGSHGLVLEVARHRNVPAREFDNASDADAWLRS